MDLSTIHQKLEQGRYKNPWEFCEDMWQMFDNAWLYNRKNSKVYKFCSKLSEIFVEEINPIMRQMGYCCGQKLSFTPLSLFCYSPSVCVIARDQPYYLYEPGSGSNFGECFVARMNVCLRQSINQHIFRHYQRKTNLLYAMFRESATGRHQHG